MIKKALVVALGSVLLTACGTTAIMKKSAAIQAQPEMVIKTDGDFWGLGKEGTFDIAGIYQGKYSRNASGSAWFNTLETNKGEMAAEITRVDSKETWQLVCSGKTQRINIASFSFDNSKPYKCKILQNDKQVGSYQMSQTSSGPIVLGMERKETGEVSIAQQEFKVSSIHESDSTFIPLERALGYSLTKDNREVAAVQTNGMLTLQMLPELSPAERDLVAVAAIASALSWRPE